MLSLCLGWQRQDKNLTEEFEICLRLEASVFALLRRDKSAKQAGQLRFREHATKSVLKNSFVPIPLSHSDLGSSFLLLLNIAS
jgi:hypothetical protein